MGLVLNAGQYITSEPTRLMIVSTKQRTSKWIIHIPWCSLSLIIPYQTLCWETRAVQERVIWIRSRNTPSIVWKAESFGTWTWSTTIPHQYHSTNTSETCWQSIRVGAYNGSRGIGCMFYMRERKHDWHGDCRQANDIWGTHGNHTLTTMVVRTFLFKEKVGKK